MSDLNNSLIQLEIHQDIRPVKMSDSLKVLYAKNNGLILCDKYIPEELIVKILCYLDVKSLLNCQLVCKIWRCLLKECVWRKKAEYIIGQSIHSWKKISWHVYYILCKKKPIGKNLLKNHSGSEGFSHWTSIINGGNRWKCESPPIGVPALPDDSVFEGKNNCFATSYALCSKQQSVDLEKEGFSPLLLDNLQPTIKVGEWYSARNDCRAIYGCTVTLITKDNKILDIYNFEDSIDNERQNLWYHLQHEFKNYGPGLRKIVFQHYGRDGLFWAGHYGSKMAGASVVVEFK